MATLMTVDIDIDPYFLPARVRVMHVAPNLNNNNNRVSIGRGRI